MRYDVALQRPNQLKIVVPGDGPGSEFYWDGKEMVAFAPAENLVAVESAPPTLEGALKQAFDRAAIYFPFTDLLLPDPYAAISPGAILAYMIGPSGIVGGVKTDMLVWANNDVFLQIWLGADDNLRRIRAQFRDDPKKLRHDLELSNWQLDGAIAADTFSTAKAKAGMPMAFATPWAQGSSIGVKPLVGGSTKPAAKPGQPSAMSAQPTPERPSMKQPMKHATLALLVAAVGGALLGWAPRADAWASANRFGGATPTPPATPRTRTAGAAAPSTWPAKAPNTPTPPAAAPNTRSMAAPSTPAPPVPPPTKGRLARSAPRPGGASYYHLPVNGAYPAYGAYHPPVAVPYYSTGCMGCAAAAGAVAGMAVGGAIAYSTTTAANAAATSNAYAAGVATGSANTNAAYQWAMRPARPAPRKPAFVMGASYAALPPGSMSVQKNGQTYYLNGNTWFLPAFGANGVHYTVVAAP